MPRWRRWQKGCHAYTQREGSSHLTQQLHGVSSLLARSLAGGAAALAPSKSWAARTASARPGDRSQHLAPISSLVAKRTGKSGRGALSGMPRGGPPPEMLEQQRDYQKYMKAREESGLPTFDLFVKGPNSPMWYPAGALQGDDNTKKARRVLDGRMALGLR